MLYNFEILEIQIHRYQLRAMQLLRTRFRESMAGNVAAILDPLFEFRDSDFEFLINVRYGKFLNNFSELSRWVIQRSVISSSESLSTSLEQRRQECSM